MPAVNPTTTIRTTLHKSLHLYFGMRKGVHYGNAVKIRNRPLDLRCEGAYAVAPWSRNAARIAYEWIGEVLPVQELPLLRVSWLREKSTARRVKPVEESIGDGIMERRAAAWIACVEGAVSGNHGHSATFRVACKLLHPPPRGFGLSLEQAFPLIWNWNVHACEPAWDEKAILHKLEDALKKR